MKTLFYTGVFAVACMVCPPTSAQNPFFGGIDDVPTWQPGDRWFMQRGFELSMEGPYEAELIPLVLELNMSVTEAYTLVNNVTSPTLIVNNQLAGFSASLAYVRERNGLIGLQITNGIIGTFRGEDGEIGTPQLLLNGGLESAATEGYNWTSVGDLGQIRDTLTMPPAQGSMTVTGNPSINNLLCNLLPGLTNENFPENGVECGDTVPFKVSMTLTIDHAAGVGETTGPFEVQDFPLLYAGEQWAMNGLRRFGGQVHIQAIPFTDGSGEYLIDTILEIPAETLVQLAMQITLEAKGINDPTRPLYTNARHIRAVNLNAAPPNNVEDIYYTPDFKDLTTWTMTDVRLLPDNENGLNLKLRNLRTGVNPSAASPALLQPDGDISNLNITPALLGPGQSFTVTGTVGPNAPIGQKVEAMIQSFDGSALSGQGIIDGSHSFSILLTAPTAVDLSPSVGPGVAEFGSYGILLARDGELIPFNRKVATLRTFVPGNGRAVGDFNNSGCADLDDFLFIVDNWLQPVDGTVLGVEDFLALLDHWKAGPACP